MSNDPDVKAQQAEKARLIREHIYGLATGAERQETQLAAGIAYLNRVEGLPIARTITANITDPSGLTDADLANIAAAGRAGIAAPAEDQD